MGFMDKVKAQATQLADKAQQQVSVGQSKVEEALAKRKADAALRSMGLIVFHQRTGRAEPDGESRLSALVSELQTFEAAHGPIGDGDDGSGDTPDASGGAAGGGVPSASGDAGIPTSVYGSES